MSDGEKFQLSQMFVLRTVPSIQVIHEVHSGLEMGHTRTFSRSTIGFPAALVSVMMYANQ